MQTLVALLPQEATKEEMPVFQPVLLSDILQNTFSNELQHAVNVGELKKAFSKASEDPEFLYEIHRNIDKLVESATPEYSDLMKTSLDVEKQLRNLEKQKEHTSADEEAIQGLREMKEQNDREREAIEQPFCEDLKTKLLAMAQHDAASVDEHFQELLDNFPALFSEGSAKKVSKALLATALGTVDDLSTVLKFMNVEEDLTLERFLPHRAKLNTYHTSMGFGLLAYCLFKFIEGRGKMEIAKERAEITLEMGVRKKVAIPQENSDGSIQWKNGKVPVKVGIKAKLYRDTNLNTNVVVFEMSSEYGHFAMAEFKSIMQEILTNPSYYMCYFLNDNVHVDQMNFDNTEFTEDELRTFEGDAAAEEDVAARAE